MKILAFFAVVLVIMTFIVIIARSPIEENFSVTVAWDANSEPRLTGYKIYYGKTSRNQVATDVIDKWCAQHERTNEKCLEEWRKICEPEDIACHPLLFGYDKSVDVCNVLKFTIAGLEKGFTYYLAATAYDKDGNESLFTDELVYTPGYSKQDVTNVFSRKPTPVR